MYQLRPYSFSQSNLQLLIYLSVILNMLLILTL